MYYQNDWILRQVEMISAFIARLVFKRNDPDYVIIDETNLSQTDLLHRVILELLSKGEICKAEDLLFENAVEENVDYLAVAVDFYSRLNHFSDKDLEDGGFSREEIMEGLESFMKKYGVDLPMG